MRSTIATVLGFAFSFGFALLALLAYFDVLTK
jgi:hypothetical protein